jgi:enoyl-CoA hydratase
MGHHCFDVQIDEKVAHIVLNRPEKRNSMIPEFWDELPAIVKEIDGESKARVIVISSTGPHFCAGLDLAVFGGSGAGAKASEEEKKRRRLTRGASFYDDVRRMQRSLSCLEEARIPVLVAIQGGAIGGGVDLATACDIRYATEDAFLCIQEINIGMTADVGTFPRLVKLIPEGTVRELAYTGRRMPAAEAKAVGLVNRVFPDQPSMLEGVLDIAHQIASKSPLAVYGSKRMINYARDHSTADGLDYIGIWNASFLQPEEMGEAMSANAEKREGDFVDLPLIRKSQSEETF